ncbi:PH domain-containing protein [Lapillicoccus sp.]|uniref:PH domain-containing protein n=1 Tax=Lapillicoccus sp. TaxID=1909287 RepID=UPI0025D42083|nr:PH domain-containing protein [Lapillicoccus sp.]
MADEHLPSPPPGDDPFRVFRSRRGRIVATTMGVLAVLIFVGISVGLQDATPTDRILISTFGIAIAVMCWRYATIRATPTRQGLVVRNLMTTRELTWPQVLKVQYGGGAPWVTLDLDDTDSVAVMAIQRADGPVSSAEASRLAALVQALGEARP